MGVHSGMFILVCLCNEYKMANQPIYEEFVQNQRPDLTRVMMGSYLTIDRDINSTFISTAQHRLCSH